MQLNQHRSAFVMLAPATALLGVFIIVPMLLTIWLSFHDWSTQTGFETARFVGIQNFIDIFAGNSVGRDFKAALHQHRDLHRCSRSSSSCRFRCCSACSSTRQHAPGGVFLRTVLFSTYMVPMIAVALVFSKLYSPTEGPLNQILGWIGIAAADLAVVAADRARCRSSSSTSGSRSATSPCSPSPG